MGKLVTNPLGRLVDGLIQTQLSSNSFLPKLRWPFVSNSNETMQRSSKFFQSNPWLFWFGRAVMSTNRPWAYVVNPWIIVCIFWLYANGPNQHLFVADINGRPGCIIGKWCRRYSSCDNNIPECTRPTRYGSVQFDRKTERLDLKKTLKLETARWKWNAVSLIWEQKAAINLARLWCTSLARWSY